MRRRGILLVVMALAVGADLVEGAPLRRKTIVGSVRMEKTLPPDLTAPDGRSRWDLTGVSHGRQFTHLLTSDGDTVTSVELGPSGEPVSRTIATGEDALSWHFPDRASGLLRPGTRHVLEFEEESVSGVRMVRAEVETIGIGWIHLPSGPREAVLQRALILSGDLREGGLRPDRIVDRWIDPRAGVVATTSGPARADGRGRRKISSATTVQAVIEGASTLTISVSELDPDVGKDLLYGFDLGVATPISSLDPNGYTTMGDLIAQDVWDFSGNNSGTEISFHVAPVDANQTCNINECGYSDPNALLERNDIGFDDPNLSAWAKINTTIVKEDRGTDYTMWLRGGSVNEGLAGAFGTGETRICYETFDGTTRSEVPLWQFQHVGATEFFMQPGDTWAGGPFNCEQTLFNQVCGASQLFDKLYAKACSDHTGTQGTTVLKGGVVTLPSGHTFNSLLAVTVADFCVYLGSGCSSLLKADEVRTVNYLWQVPHIGTVVRLESEQDAPDTTSYTEVVETNITYGLFPPRSITATTTTDTTVSLSWDPGLITTRIDGYKIYWDTDSGSSSTYAFNSESDPNSVSIVGTTATISGLAAGTDYFVTVTSLSDFPPDPATPLPRLTYESLLYPTTVSGDPSFVYPAEVQAMTTGGSCIPTAEVTNVTAVDDPNGVQICWDPVSDPCLTGYRVLGSNTADSETGYTTVADLGVQTCWTGNPTETFFVVTAKGTGGDGPWGHYGL